MRTFTNYSIYIRSIETSIKLKINNCISDNSVHPGSKAGTLGIGQRVVVDQDVAKCALVTGLERLAEPVGVLAERNVSGRIEVGEPVPVVAA